MPEIKVIAAVVDTAQLTLYKEDGTTILILQGDPRLKRIVDECIVPIQTQGFAMIDLTKENTFRQFEEKSSGLVRFFRVAKKALADMFKVSEPVEPISIGSPPDMSKLAEMEARIKQNEAAVQEILKRAVPTTDPKFTEDSPGAKDDTVVAVVEGQIIPDVGLMEGHITRATKTSTKGMEVFMQRLAEVVKVRRHSVQELMNFMERGDLPVADDGSLVIYKVLRRAANGRYVDCHTRRVDQGIGSYVCMDEKLVDLSRYTECSVGLHVARRGYLGNFDGDVCVIAKVQPEEVITVPSGEPNKMRVCGYHILFQLDDDSYAKLRQNRAFTDNPKAQALLGRAISGDHPPPKEKVTIGGPQGENVVITSLVTEPTIQRRDKPVTRVEALAEDEVTKADPVSPVEVAKEVEKVQENIQEAISPDRPVELPLGNRQAEARKLYEAFVAATSGSPEELTAAQALVAFKKAKKVSWASLGLTNGEVEDVMEVMNPKKA